MGRLFKGHGRRAPSPSFKYIFSYIIVATIPLIIISFFSYQFFIGEYRDEVLQNRASSLTMVRNSFEMMLTQMENHVRQIEMEDDLLQYDLEEGMLTTVNLHNRLVKYQLASGYLRDILFYRHGSDYICAASSTYRLDNYVGFVNQMSGVTPEKFAELLNESTFRHIFVQTEKRIGASPVETVSFLYPMPYNDVSPYATVVFTVEAAQIRAFFGSGESGGEYAIAVEGGEGPVFILSDSDGDEDGMAAVFARASEMKEHQGSFVEEMDGVSYMISYLRDPLKGVTYLYRTPERLALTKVESIRNLFLMLILLLTAVEFGVVFCVSYINYRPIKSLRKYLSDNFDEVPDEEGEIQAARRILADMLLNHERMSEKLSLNTDTLREVVLYKLINGGFSSREELARAAGEAGVSLTKPFLRVAIFQAGEETPPPECAALRALFLESLGEDLEIYCCTFPPRIVFVLAGDLSVEQEFRRGFDRLQDRLAEISVQYCIGVGGVQQDISRLHLSYIQAATALDYRFVSGSNHVVFYTDILSDREIFDSYPQGEITELRESILAGNAERFSYLVDEIIALLGRRDSNLILGKLVSYDVLNTVIRTLLEANKGYTDISARSPDIMLLASMHSVGELTETLLSLRDRVVDLLGDERTDNPFIGQVLAVIDENLENYSFTVRELAERFHISQNNLSQRFKRAMNMTPIEYINRQKIERAKLYLSGTDLPLRTIVERLGYSNESSFIRKFKATAGLTPGEYRKKMNLHKE